MRPRLAVAWMAWAAKNQDSLKMTAAASMSDAPAVAADPNDESADLLGS